MSWLKISDLAATDARVLSLSVKDRSAVFGFVALLASLSAQQLTDGQIPLEWGRVVAGLGYRSLSAKAIAAGLLVETDGGWRLPANDVVFHVMDRSDVEWNRLQAADRANPARCVPVRFRDGDSCRFCGRRVYWADRKSGQGATIRTTGDGLAVCCRDCARDTPAGTRPTLPAPTSPYYADGTIQYLTRHCRFLEEDQLQALNAREVAVAMTVGVKAASLRTQGQGQ